MSIFSTVVNNFLPDDRFTVYPNPFNNELIINGDYNGEMILFDITGKEILHQKIIAGENKINTENLLPGFYLVNYVNGDRTENIKVVKK